jgi:hypothetical protein
MARALRRDRTAAVVAVILLVAFGSVVAWRGGVGAVLPRISDIGAWLSNTKEGSVVHANGVSGDADAEVTLRDAQGHPLKVTQDGDTVLVLDTVTGVVSRIDPAQLRITQSVNYGSAGAQVVARGELAYFIDPAYGIVQRIDVTKLSAVGYPIVLNRRLGAGGIDREGTLWVPAPDAGELVPIADGVVGAPVRVGEPGDVLSLTIANGTPVATNATRNTMTVLSRTGGQLTVNLPALPETTQPGDGPLLAPLATEGPMVPLVVEGTGQLVVVDTETGNPTSVTLAGVRDDKLGTPAALGTRIYVPDNTTGKLIVYDVVTGQLLDQITVTGRTGKMDLFVKDGLLWVNDAGGPDAISVEPSGKVHRIGKYDDDLPGSSPSPTPTAQPSPVVEPPPAVEQPPVVEPPPANSTTQPAPAVAAPPAASSSSAPPPAPPAPPPTSSTAPPPPPPTPPPPPPPTLDPPGSVTQEAGAGLILVTFTPPSGGGVTDYTLTGVPAGANVTPQNVPGPGPYEFTVTGLSCDNQYRFSVSANYPTGSASTTAGARVRPCVAPSAPRNLRVNTGTQHQLGLAWDPPASDGGGTVHYDVSWNGGQHPDLSGTTDTITGLANFQNYTVTVEAVNMAGASQPPASTSVRLAPGTWGGNVNNTLFELYARAQPNTGSALLYVFPAGSFAAVTVVCITPGGSWVDPTGTPSGSTWYRVSSPVNGYIAAGYVDTQSGVWEC